MSDEGSVITLDPDRTIAYLARLGVAPDDATADLRGLTLLHERHLRTIPFENLDISLRSRSAPLATAQGTCGPETWTSRPARPPTAQGMGEPIVLEVNALVDKLTVRRRGGFCYELNGAFAALLTALGFAVTLFEARVGPDGGGMRFDHLCLGVRGDGVDHLADVGFGASFLRPLRMGTTAPQPDPGGTYRLVSAGDGEIDMVEDGTPQYRFALTPRALADFAGGCRYHQTSPDSHFTQSTVCSLATPTGRVTIADRTLIVTTGGERIERVVDDDATLLALYREHFDITLEDVPVARHATAQG